jgi:hypothetical protein
VETDRIPRPTEAIRFLEKKINVPTEKWDDLKWGEHAHAFTVAHSAEANILDDIHGLLNKAISSGESYETWRKGMLEAMDKKGWYGGNGHTKDETKYINWRLRVIYDTNMSTAYQAAQYRKQLQDAEGRPVWVYKSKVFGDHRRQEHIALHDKAFRYDDPFWDTHYPPNGWGCQCYVTTKSEAGAEREGIAVKDSAVKDLPEIDPTWAYNPGREALAANFNKYGNLPKEAVTEAQAKYNRDMNNTCLTEGEFITLARRANSEDIKGLGVLYQAGNVEAERFKALQRHQVPDSKIVCFDSRLRHGIGRKNEGQKVPERLFGDLYQTIQAPEAVYEEDVTALKKPYRVFHFVKDTKDGKKIKVVLHLGNGTALQIRTMGYAEYEYKKRIYKKIW